MQKSKFKVGDRVEDKYRGEGTIIDIIEPSILYLTILVQYDKEFVGGHNGNGVSGVKGEDKHCYWENASDLKRVEDKDMKAVDYAITIIRDGSETRAIYTSFGGTTDVTKTAVARCHPEDTYNFKIGADIAYKRLMGNPEPDKSDSDTNHVYTDKEWQEVEKVYRDRCDEIVDIKAELRCINDNCNYWKSKYTNLKDKLSKQKEINKELVDEHAELIRDYAHKSDLLAELEEQVDKQKKINKELVDENENLKAEIKKLKACNKEIEVYDTVEIVNSKACYCLYEEWIDKYSPTRISNRFKLGYAPENGDIGLVVAKAKHETQDKMLCEVLIDGQAYIMGEQGIKLHNN